MKYCGKKKHAGSPIGQNGTCCLCEGERLAKETKARRFANHRPSPKKVRAEFEPIELPEIEGSETEAPKANGYAVDPGFWS